MLPTTSALDRATTRPLFPTSSSRTDYRFDDHLASIRSWREPAARPTLAYQQLPADKRAHFEKLLAQKDRPTLAQLRKVMRAAYGDEQPTENPFGKARHVAAEEATIVDMVAQLEHAFPGGKYLPLGRDAVLLADLLDGFYTAIGQKGRVKRLDMSGESLPHYRDANPRTYEEDRPMIYGFLKANGLDLEHAHEKAPYVMIDVTSYGDTSQSTQLVRSIYRTWTKDMGRDPKDLYDRVNFVGTHQYGPATFISDHRDIDSVKARLRAGTGTDGPKALLYLGGNTKAITYTAAWHKDFRKMSLGADGKVTAEPGRQSSTETKEEVLAELFEANRLVSSPTFVAKVKQLAADKYGYEFPMTQTEHPVRIAGAARVSAPAPSRPSIELASLASPGSVGTEAPRETGFLASLKARLPLAANKPEVAADFMRDLAGMRARHSYTKSDGKHAVREMARHVDFDSPGMKYELRKIYADFPGFQREVESALRRSRS